MKTKEIKLALRKYSTLNDAEIKESLIDHMRKEVVLKLKNELNFVVNEVVENMNCKVYEVSVNFLYANIPKNEEELLDIIKLLIEKYYVYSNLRKY